MAENPNTGPQEDTADAVDDILEIARARFKLAAEAESDFRIAALDDLKFSNGEQWPDEIKRQRDLDSRPCLVINRLPQFIRRLTNDQRQNRPSIKVNPVDDGADVETAKVRQGLIRHIEYDSNADIAYDTAFEGAVRMGRGFFRILTQYESHESFDQELKIKRIRNPFMVYMDPNSKEPDGSDMNWCFIVEDVGADEYRSQYKDSKLASLTDFESLGDAAPDWVSKEVVRVAEYFYKEFTPVELVMLTNGTVLPIDQLPKELPQGIKVKQRRTAQVPVIKWCKINAVEIIEGLESGKVREWVGQWIPVIPVYGEEIDINGKLVLKGVVRDAKDPQRMYNYWKSSETETIALAPRVPYLGAEGQFEGHEAKWKTANSKNHAYLEYKPVSLNGQLAAPPMRQVFEAPVQAITQASMQAADDIKATTGIYDASLGNRSNESSGIAIQRRNQQAQTSNFHFIDNFTRSLRHAGRILDDAIPLVYDTPRAVRIIRENDEQEIVKINQVFQDGKEAKAHNMDAGKFDVAVSTGPSYETKRQEAVASMLELTKTVPQVGQAAPELLVRAMDWHGAQEVADRLKKMLPPGLADDKEMQQPLPPQVKQQMDQMSGMVDALTKQLHAAHDIIDTRKMELDSKERIAAMQTQAEVEIALAKISSTEGVELLRTDVARIEARLAELHEHSTIDAQAQNAAAQSQFSNAGPAGAVPTENPTGGQSPGQPMEQSSDN